MKRTCREVRALLQSLADARAGSTGGAEGLREEAAAHLSRCPRCRGFQELLAEYPGRLAAALEAEVRGLPVPSLLAAPGRPERLRAHPAASHTLGKRLRWVLPSAAAALLALAVGLPLAAVQARTLRGIRLQMSAVVDRAYDRPLAEGVESGLIRVVDRDRLLEELDAEAGLRGLGGGSFPE